MNTFAAWLVALAQLLGTQGYLREAHIASKVARVGGYAHMSTCRPIWLPRRAVEWIPLGVWSKIVPWKRITVIDLSDANGDDALFRDIMKCRHVGYVSVWMPNSCELSFDWIGKLDRLDAIQLSSESFPDEMFRHIARNASVQCVCIIGERIGDQALSYLVNSRNIREISLIGIIVNEAVARDLAQMSVVSVSLCDTSAGDAEVGAMCQSRTISNLSLERTLITDSAIDSLRRLPSLLSLDLSGTSIGDGACVELSRIKTLKYIDIRGTCITEAGLRALKWALPECRIMADITVEDDK